VLCLRCDFQGSIYKAKINGIDEVVYICDECGGVWLDPSRILRYPNTVYGKDFLGIDDFLERYGFEPMNADINNLGYNWDKSILKSNAIVLCPYCYNRGIIYKALIGTLGVTIYYCDNCNRVWHNAQQISQGTTETLRGFLKAKGLDYTNARLAEFELEWNK
jgi:Zn-finger nucleic acid-binding protein